MEHLAFDGRAFPGFALGQPTEGNKPGIETLAAVTVGATAGLLLYVLKAPLWGSILTGVGAAFLTKVSIDRAAA